MPHQHRTSMGGRLSRAADHTYSVLDAVCPRRIVGLGQSRRAGDAVRIRKWIAVPGCGIQTVGYSRSHGDVVWDPHVGQLCKQL